MDTDPDLIAPCGMNCGICSAYLAKTHDTRARGVRMPYCAGCRPGDKKCALLKKRCGLLLEGRVQFCYECPEFPCSHLKTIDKRYRERYRMSMVENLRFVKEHGVGAFLESETEKWRCPDCGGTICVHNGICFDCGLEQLRAKKQMYRWEEL